MPLAQARAELAAKLQASLPTLLSSAASPAPVIVVRAPGGIGKTHMLTQKLSGHSVVWFGERKQMMPEIQTFLDTPLPGVTPLLQPPGRVQVEKRPAREDQGMCPDFALEIKPLRDRGLGRFEQSRGCRRCASFAGCPYFAWKPSSSWTFAPAIWLELKVKNTPHFDGKQIAVIDESPLQHVLQGVSLSAKEIDSLLADLQASPLRASLAYETFTKLLVACGELLRDPPPHRRRVELRELLRDLGFQFVDAPQHWHVRMRDDLLAAGAIPSAAPAVTKPGGIKVDPGCVARVLQYASALSTEQKKKLMALADALIDDESERPCCVLVLPDGKARSGIVAGRYVAPQIPATMPILVLDATADRLLYDVIFEGRTIAFIDVDLQVAAEIIQTTDFRYPSRTFKAASSNTIERLMAIVDEYQTQHVGQELAVVVKKDLFDTDTKFKNRVLQSVPPDHVFFYWSLRGRNDLKDFDAIFLIGAPELSPLDMEAMARAFMSRHAPKPGEKPFDYRVVPVPGQQRSGWSEFTSGGKKISLPDRGYLQVGPDAVYWALHQAEYVQAALRIRPYDPAQPKTVFVLTSADLGMLDVTFAQEKDLLPTAPPKRLLEAKAWLEQHRAAGHVEKVTHTALAQAIGVSKGRWSQLKKKVRGLRLLAEVESLMDEV
jgi:hypothetical protein